MENKLLDARRVKFGIYESALASILFIIYNFLFLLFYRMLPVSFRMKGVVSFVAQFLLEALFAVAAITVAVVKNVDIKKAAGLNKKINGKIVGLGFLISLVCIIGFGNLTNVFLELLNLCGYSSILSDFTINTFWQYLVYVLVSCLVPAVCEELLFRGVILSGMKQYGAKIAIVISSLIFMLMHGNAEQTVHQFIVGLVVGYLFFATGNLWLGVIVHFFNNFISVTQLYILTVIQNNSNVLDSAVEATETASSNPWLSLLFSAIIAFVFAFFGYQIVKFLFKKILAEDKKLNGSTEELTSNASATATVDGKEVEAEISSSTQSEMKEEDVIAGQSELEKPKIETLPVSAIVMFCLSGAYLVVEWISALISGFGLF